MTNRSMFVGMDVHKETIDVAIADGDRNGDVRHYGVIPAELGAVDKLVRALTAPNRLSFAKTTAPLCGGHRDCLES